MCHPHLVWSVWRLAGLVVWTYHAMPGHLIPAWELCFTSTQGEATGQWEHEVGLLSRARQDRLVYVPSVNCQDQVTPLRTRTNSSPVVSLSKRFLPLGLLQA